MTALCVFAYLAIRQDRFALFLTDFSAQRREHDQKKRLQQTPKYPSYFCTSKPQLSW